MEILSLIFLFVLVFLISAWLIKKSDGRKSLPGPMGLPLVGYLPFMTKRPFLKLTKLADTYGPIYSIRMGSQNVVVICDFKLIKEAFATDAFMGRPSIFELSETTVRTGAFLDIAWKEQRRFSLHMLRDLGFGKTRMEEHMKEEILELLQRMSEKSPVEMVHLLLPSMSNNVASFIFGKRLKYSHPKRQKLDGIIKQFGPLAGGQIWQSLFPWIAAITKRFNLGNRGKLIKCLTELRNYCMEEMENHQKTLDPNNIQDFMDGYLLEIQKRSNDPNSSFQKDVLVDIARVFFGAGSETVRMTVEWMLLVAAAYPEVQERMQKEIEQVLGSDTFPRWQDRLNMPFTEAAILELMRWRTIIPLNVMRYTLQDTELAGYFIPKHYNVVAILWAVDHDVGLWGEDVNVYRPERFLSDDGKKVVKPEHFIPFSIGKRSCPGRPLAEAEVFLYVTAILQKFKVSMPTGKEADLEGTIGIGLMPKRQELCVEVRH